jgi:hypothetical protein
MVAQREWRRGFETAKFGQQQMQTSDQQKTEAK